MSEAEGLQESLKEVLQQQTIVFQEQVDAAHLQMETQMKKFAEEMGKQLATVNEQPEKPVYEAKILDGGLWLNKDLSEALIDIVEQMTSIFATLEKELK